MNKNPASGPSRALAALLLALFGCAADPIAEVVRKSLFPKGDACFAASDYRGAIRAYSEEMAALLKDATNAEKRADLHYYALTQLVRCQGLAFGDTPAMVAVQFLVESCGPQLKRDDAESLGKWLDDHYCPNAAAHLRRKTGI